MRVSLTCYLHVRSCEIQGSPSAALASHLVTEAAHGPRILKKTKGKKSTTAEPALEKKGKGSMDEVEAGNAVTSSEEASSSSGGSSDESGAATGMEATEEKSAKAGGKSKKSDAADRILTKKVKKGTHTKSDAVPSANSEDAAAGIPPSADSEDEAAGISPSAESEDEDGNVADSDDKEDDNSKHGADGSEEKPKKHKKVKAKKVTIVLPSPDSSNTSAEAVPATKAKVLTNSPQATSSEGVAAAAKELHEMLETVKSVKEKKTKMETRTLRAKTNKL